jgi:hypothetical protein
MFAYTRNTHLLVRGLQLQVVFQMRCWSYNTASFSYFQYLFFVCLCWERGMYMYKKKRTYLLTHQHEPYIP